VFVALGIQDAMRMRHIVMCGLPSLYHILPHYLKKRARFSKKKSHSTQNVCFDFFHKFFSETFLILRRTEGDIITNVHRSVCKVPVIVV
jgi:hypothetical protein